MSVSIVALVFALTNLDGFLSSDPKPPPPPTTVPWAIDPARTVPPTTPFGYYVPVTSTSP